MAKELTPLEFVTKLKDCVKEYNRKLAETRDDRDAAHFYNSSLKKFLNDHIEEITVLSTLNFERSFFKWVKHYLLN